MNGQKYFKQAIELGVLSDNPNDTNYAGLFMLMCVVNEGDYNEVIEFKNINDRRYKYLDIWSRNGFSGDY